MGIFDPSVLFLEDLIHGKFLAVVPLDSHEHRGLKNLNLDKVSVIKMIKGDSSDENQGSIDSSDTEHWARRGEGFGDTRAIENLNSSFPFAAFVSQILEVQVLDFQRTPALDSFLGQCG